MMPVARARAERALAGMVRRVQRIAGRKRGEISVILLSNRTLRALKRQYLHREARVVDVLAFPEPPHFPHPERKKPLLGEVYLNEGFLGDPARLRRSLVHGVLHILGYRHGRRRDMILMERLERKVLRKLSSV